MTYSRHLNKQRGLTLIELMVTLAIATILITIGVPSFRNTIENNQILTLSDKMSASLKLARSEAVSRGQSITMCSSNDQSTCSGSWNDGWIIFIDEDADRNLDGGTDTLLQANRVDSQDYTVSLISTIATSFQFNGEGRAPERGTYQICGPTGDAVRSRGIVIQLSGNARYAVDTDSDGVREAHSGLNFSC